jgi:hypothetical protein
MSNMNNAVRNKNLSKSSDRKPSTSTGIRYSSINNPPRITTYTNNGMRRTFKAPPSKSCKIIILIDYLTSNSYFDI